MNQQTHVLELKAAGFDVYLQLNQVQQNYRVLESALNHIAQMFNYPKLPEEGLEGLMVHLQGFVQTSAPVPADSVE